MFTPQGPTFRELAVQALSSTERGYDLLAPKFDETPFRTPDRVLDEAAAVLTRLGPFDAGIDLCCGTGAGVDVLRQLCRERVVAVDFSAGMLAAGRRAAEATGAAEAAEAASGPVVDWVRADVRRLPFGRAFDLAVSFGAFGHFLPKERPALFAQVHDALRPGGRFAFPVVAPARVCSPLYWALWGFDAVMQARNVLLRPPFTMYYRTFQLTSVRAELEQVGFTVETAALPGLGFLEDGSPRCRLVVARRAD
ncbi:class I SAM-dependent methyltransferase [Streptacidiphilus cavernicola]|uniref:Class I SAM-dependent methyltransferase n=1 Tax=Streptacidiphilus cavernicola TaxID=3342716 RepID=A0ABV6VWB4_9ACTN